MDIENLRLIYYSAITNNDIYRNLTASVQIERIRNAGGLFLLVSYHILLLRDEGKGSPILASATWSSSSIKLIEGEEEVYGSSAIESF